MSISPVWWEILHQPDKPIPCCVNRGPFSWGQAPHVHLMGYTSIRCTPCKNHAESMLTVDCLSWLLPGWWTTALNITARLVVSHAICTWAPFQCSTTMDTTTDGVRPCSKALGNFFCSTPASLNIKDNCKTFNDLNLASEEKTLKMM